MKAVKSVPAITKKKAVADFIATLSSLVLITIAHFAKPVHGLRSVPLNCGDGKLHKAVADELVKRGLMTRNSKHLRWSLCDDAKEVLDDCFFNAMANSPEDSFFTKVLGFSNPWKDMWKDETVAELTASDFISPDLADHIEILASLVTDEINKGSKEEALGWLQNIKDSLVPLTKKEVAKMVALKAKAAANLAQLNADDDDITDL